MNNKIEELLKQLKEFGINLDSPLDAYRYTKNTLKQAYISGKIEGLKVAGQIKKYHDK